MLLVDRFVLQPVCVGCVDSLAEGNIQLLCVAKALLLAFCWQKKGSNCGPVNIVMHMLAQTGLCTPYAVCPNTQHLVPVFQAFHSLSSFLCRGILVSGMQFLWCHQCWVNMFVLNSLSGCYAKSAERSG